MVKEAQARVALSLNLTLSVGLKYKQYRIGILTGYGKGFAGVEFGYQFK